ncbi:MAG: LysR family transcriptional regulator [Rhodocyclaceae bacterium]
MSRNIRVAKMNSEFDWSLIQSFLAVLRHGSLLAAARHLEASQPTIGRHIAELERQLGVALFERTGRGLVPTDMALRLADAARAMDAGAQQLARQLTDSDQALAGSVRISASQPVACHLLPPILVQMRQAIPGVRIDLVVSNEVSNLLRREADIALRMVAPEQSSLIARRVGAVELTACAHVDYLRRYGVPRQVKDLLAHDLIGGDLRNEAMEGLVRHGVPVTEEHFALRTDDLIASWQAIRAGLGIGFAAQYLVRNEPQVDALLPTLKIPALPVWLVVHREIRGNPRIKAVYDYLAAAIPRQL